MSDEFQPTSLLMGVIPESLLDIKKTISTSRSNSLEKVHSLVEVYRNCRLEFDKLDQQYSDFIKEQQNKLKNLSTEKELLNQELENLQKEQMELEKHIEYKKTLCEEKVASDTDDDELSELMKKVCELKDEMEVKKGKTLHDINEFERGIQYYNKYLGCNVLIEEENVFFTSDVSASQVSEINNYIKFTTEDGITFKYIEMKPKLENEPSLAKQYLETEDIQGLIIYFFKSLSKGENTK